MTIHYLGALDDLDLGGELDPAAHPQPGALVGLPDRPVAHAARVVRHLEGSNNGTRFNRGQGRVIRTQLNRGGVRL